MSDRKKENFRYYAARHTLLARTNQKFRTYDDESGDNASFLNLAKQFDKKLATKIEAINAAHRDLDSYLIEQFNEAEGDGTTKGR